MMLKLTLIRFSARLGASGAGREQPPGQQGARDDPSTVPVGAVARDHEPRDYEPRGTTSRAGLHAALEGLEAALRDVARGS